MNLPGIPHPHNISMMQCYINITKQSTWAENSKHSNGSGHVRLFYIRKNFAKVGMITGSNIAIAPSFQVCYQNLMLKGACKSEGKPLT